MKIRRSRATFLKRVATGLLLFAGCETKHEKPKQSKRPDIVALERVGAYFSHDHENKLVKVRFVFTSSVFDSTLKHLEGFEDLEELMLNWTNITDDGLQYLEGLTKLKTLDLRECQITDVGLVSLSDLVNLEKIR